MVIVVIQIVVYFVTVAILKNQDEMISAVFSHDNDPDEIRPEFIFKILSPPEIKQKLYYYRLL